MLVLERFPEYMDFRTRSRTRPRPVTAEQTESETPEEALDAAYNELRATLIEDLRVRLVGVDDRFFEEVVLDVLVALGYGGSKRDAAERVGRSGDGGVDGVIREDALGLDAIYVQAKKWALIDGAELASLMVDAEVGATVVRRFDIKRVDEDYFTGPE